MPILVSRLLRHSGGRTAPVLNSSRQCPRHHGIAIAIAAALCATAPSARALTLLLGDTYYPLLNSGTASLAELDMQGGTMLLSRAGAGSLTLTLPSLLREGGIFSYYPVTSDPALQYEVHFLQGASLPGPVSGSYAGATQAFVFGDATLEGAALKVFNHAAFTQSGVGALQVDTVALFTNLAGASYDIRNDRGISGTGGFVNAAGASIVKSAGPGTSTIGLRLDSLGLIRAESGILEIAAPGPEGNRYGGGRIETSGFASVSLSGVHTIDGAMAIAGSTNLTSQSRLDINAPLTLGPSSRLDLYSASQTRIASTGRVDLLGTGGSSVLTVGQGATMNNAGVIALGENTVLDVRGKLDGANGTLTNMGGIVVVRPGASIVTKDYTQDSTELSRGELVVDGTLDANGTGVVLLSGKLSGSGTINGELVVGCDPCAENLGTLFGPGNSPGTFTVHGGNTLLPSSELVLEVEKRADGSVAFDRLVADAMWLDGKVRFEVGAGITDADLLGVSFIESAEPLAFGSHFNWVVTGYADATVSFDASGLRIESLGAVPEPGSGGLLLAGVALVAYMMRRQGMRTTPHRVAAGLVVGAAAPGQTAQPAL